VALALILKDNRAFCKYACPIAVPLKLGTRFALLKVEGDASKCCERRVCEKVCPMDIRIADYIARGERVLSTECILCQACLSVCPEQALTLSFGLDRGGVELLRERESGVTA
jgi:polyferredoxin